MLDTDDIIDMTEDSAMRVSWPIEDAEIMCEAQIGALKLCIEKHTKWLDYYTKWASEAEERGELNLAKMWQKDAKAIGKHIASLRRKLGAAEYSMSRILDYKAAQQVEKEARNKADEERSSAVVPLQAVAV
jgi:hypothetical protein